MDSLIPGTKMILDDIMVTLKAKAQAFQDNTTKAITSMDEIPKEDTADLRVYTFGWCGCEECGHKFEDEHDIKILGTPYRPEGKFEGKCIVCGKDTELQAYAARTM